MARMTFRFTTECEMTLEGRSYEEIYLQFKDFLHGKEGVQEEARVRVYPPESDQMFFALEDEAELTEIPYFKGDFDEDIADRSPAVSLRSPDPGGMTSLSLSQKVAARIPDVY